MTDPAHCGPVTLAFCQDVQAEAYDYPKLFRRKTGLAHPPPASAPDEHELQAARSRT
jgi:3D-(3,5/4)-trihydroxycyclohexane-1,2-dione acylhydrolase (decyclizing)